jgi:predicted nucleic acid-binding protein
MRIVVDVNILVAALRSPAGRNREVIRACVMDRALPLMGAALFLECESVLGREHLFHASPLSFRERREFFEGFLGLCEWVPVFYLWRPNLPDEGDNHILELAVAGAAQAIVTNNVADFRRGELSFPNVAILTPKQFLEKIT